MSKRVFSWRQRMQHLVQQLQRSVQVNLQPAGGVLDALPRVITPPTFNEAQTHDTQPAQVVHAQTCRRAHAWRETGSHNVTHLSDSRQQLTGVFLKASPPHCKAPMMQDHAVVSTQASLMFKAVLLHVLSCNVFYTFCC